MKQTDKDLLLKDLSERLPYGVVVKTPQGDGYLNEISLGIFGHELGAIVESCDERLKERIRELHDWFDANKFDYRGLIHKGLAIEATEVIIHL